MAFPEITDEEARLLGGVARRLAYLNIPDVTKVFDTAHLIKSGLLTPNENNQYELLWDPNLVDRNLDEFTAFHGEIMKLLPVIEDDSPNCDCLPMKKKR